MVAAHRASGQALVAPIALHEAEGSDKGLCEARLWLTAATETTDAVFQMLSPVRHVDSCADGFCDCSRTSVTCPSAALSVLRD